MINRILSVLFLSILFISCVSAEDRRQDTSHLTIMTLNTEFLWDGVDPEEGQVTFPWKNSQVEAEEHMRRIAEIIIRSNPDIVSLVEVENENALSVLNDSFLAGRGYLPYFVKGKDTYTGQDMALLTRIDPEGDAIHFYDKKGQSGGVQKSVSKNYYAKMKIGNNKIALIGLHFLSGPNRQDRRFPRQAQAEAIRAIALELEGQGYELIVMGDFNDYDGSEQCRDHIDSMPISLVLDIVKSMESANSGDDLVNAASFIPKSLRYTAFYDRNENGITDYPVEFTSIDHILLDPALVSKVESVDIPHDHDPRIATDHFPVVVSLRLSASDQSAGSVRIISLLPNPEGDENINEQATLMNFGGAAISMDGWVLRDLAGKIWDLDELGTINPGEGKTITRNGKPMAMNNSGDTIDLVNENGTIIQTVTYPSAQEGEVITFQGN